VPDEVGPAVEAEAMNTIGFVCLYGFHAQAQGSGDVFVAMPTRDQGKYLSFACAETRARPQGAPNREAVGGLVTPRGVRQQRAQGSCMSAGLFSHEPERGVFGARQIAAEIPEERDDVADHTVKLMLGRHLSASSNGARRLPMHGLDQCRLRCGSRANPLHASG
jgi:hypothetical protein